jgi:hypothetical protein
MSFRRIAMICAVPTMLATPTLADPTLGLGLSFSFGGGQVDTGVGLRVFSDNERDSLVGSVGVDYMFGSQSWRGTVGAAYLGNNSYFGLDLGIGLRDGAIDFGASAGVADTKRARGTQPVPNQPFPDNDFTPINCSPAIDEGGGQIPNQC